MWYISGQRHPSGLVQGIASWSTIDKSWTSSDAQKGTHSLRMPLISKIFCEVLSGVYPLGRIVPRQTDAEGAVSRTASHMALNPWIILEGESCWTLFVPTCIMTSWEYLEISPFWILHRTFSILSPPIPKLFTGSDPNSSSLGSRQKLEMSESPMNVIRRLRRTLSWIKLACFTPHGTCEKRLSVLLRKDETLFCGISGFGIQGQTTRQFIGGPGWTYDDVALFVYLFYEAAVRSFTR